MKKNRIFRAVLCAGMLTASLFSSSRELAIHHVQAITGLGAALNGGAKITYQADSSLTSEQYITATLVETNNASNNFYVRIKNHQDTPVAVHVIMESVNGHGSQLKANGTYVLYNAMGETLENVKSVPGRHVVLPEKFDGMFSITSLNLADVPEWEQGDSTKDIKNIKAVHFGVKAETNDVLISLGDVFTRGLLNLDASELTTEEFNAAYAIKAGSAHILIERLPLQDFDINHDLHGAALVMVQQVAEDIPAYLLIKPENNDLSAADGIYIRMKNGWLYNVYIQFYLLSSNGHRMALGTEKPLYTYDVEGKNKTSILSRGFGSFFNLPGAFDGFYYFPYSSLIDDPTWEGNTTAPTMDYSDVYALIIGMSTMHDYAAQPIFGDIFTDDAIIFDGSKETKATFKNRFVPDEFGNGQYLNISQLEGYQDEPTYDFAQVTGHSATAIHGGVDITLTEATDDILASVKINLTAHLPETSLGFAMRIKNYTYDYPFFLYIRDGSGRSVTTQGEFLGNIYFLDNSGQATPNEWGGNVVSTKIPTGFDGLMILPFSAFAGGEDLDKSDIASLEFFISAKYDFYFHSSFGDIGYLADDYTYHPLVDVSSLTEPQWQQLYTKGAHPQHMNLARTIAVPPCPWIGDTKILNSCIYTSDAQMYTEVMTDVNDNPLTYERTAEGIKVTPSVYEVGHANGPYSCLAFTNNPNYSDRVKMVREEDGETAKGFTLYVKNLSAREIGVSLGFDQVTSTGGVQRWGLIGYPSMYYAYDVIQDADYIFYFKRDQFQIPVGFEGYIRLPFESYGIPDWCKTNEPLNLEKFTGNLYLAQDNRDYSELPYLVKNIGVYFNQTRAGSLFSDEFTIKANMGL